MSASKTLKIFKSDTDDPYFFPFLSTDPYVSYCVYCTTVVSFSNPNLLKVQSNVDLRGVGILEKS